mmetsp:Transcript_99519/g.197214  ORF Transcript_99519/g.197214 Transcript_99519/m.197214 type:complete len:289 (+) Transcript_99519:726-1592(+)
MSWHYLAHRPTSWVVVLYARLHHHQAAGIGFLRCQEGVPPAMFRDGWRLHLAQVLSSCHHRLVLQLLPQDAAAHLLPRKLSACTMQPRLACQCHTKGHHELAPQQLCHALLCGVPQALVKRDVAPARARHDHAKQMLAAAQRHSHHPNYYHQQWPWHKTGLTCRVPLPCLQLLSSRQAGRLRYLHTVPKTAAMDVPVKHAAHSDQGDPQAYAIIPPQWQAARAPQKGPRGHPSLRPEQGVVPPRAAQVQHLHAAQLRAPGRSNQVRERHETVPRSQPAIQCGPSPLAI